MALQNCEGLSIEDCIAKFHPWQLVKVPLKGYLGDEVLEAPETYGVYRTDGKFLGAVGERHEIVQPIDDMLRYKPLVDSGEMRIVKAGLLNDGRIFTMQLDHGPRKLKSEVVKGDPVASGVTVYTGLAGNKKHGTSTWIESTKRS